MTPKQKLRWAIVDRALQYEDKPGCSGDDVDELYDQLEDAGGLQDAVQEIRCGGIDTGLSCESSRHYESTAVAMKVPDGSWVGWTYWYGGGKHSEPEAIDWMNSRL